MCFDSNLSMKARGPILEKVFVMIIWKVSPNDSVNYDGRAPQRRVLFWFTRPPTKKYSSNALICPFYLLSRNRNLDLTFFKKNWKQSMDSLIKRLERIQKIKKEIDIFSENNDVNLHPRLKVLIPWFNYSYSIFKRLTERQRNSFSEVQKLNFTKENFKSDSEKITVRFPKKEKLVFGNFCHLYILKIISKTSILFFENNPLI